jgi:hypothetical protein
MRQEWYKFLLFLLLVAVLAATPALAANGKISGTVKSADGEPVVGANVVIEGTTLGAAADAAGKYFILDVPPGTYRVRASGVGYTPKVVADVQVRLDQFVTLNITLESQAVGMAEVVVEAARPPIDKSQTNTKTTVTSADLESLPIRNATDVLSTSASTYRGFVRGGKQYETKTIIDGVDMTDNFYAVKADQTLTPYQTYNGVVRYQQAMQSSFVDPNLSSIQVSVRITPARPQAWLPTRCVKDAATGLVARTSASAMAASVTLARMSTTTVHSISRPRLRFLPAASLPTSTRQTASPGPRTNIRSARSLK